MIKVPSRSWPLLGHGRRLDDQQLVRLSCRRGGGVAPFAIKNRSTKSKHPTSVPTGVEMTDQGPRVKRHNIIIERWPGTPGPDGRRNEPCFRWTVTYEKDGLFQVQGYAESHASAREAAEACLIERGIDLNWLRLNEEPKPQRETKKRWLRLGPS